MSQTGKKPSPSRTYVAICNRTDFSGHYFRKFHLPRGYLEGFQNKDGSYQLGSYTHLMENSQSSATWYFLNVLNSVACIDGVYSWEDFQDVKDQDEINAERERQIQEMLGTN